MTTAMTETPAGRDFDPIPSWRPADDCRLIDSNIPHIKNMGGENAGTITAALFLDEFTGGTPFGHLDICGLMVSDTDDGWRPTGATGFATRLLSSVACNFRRPATSA